MRNRDKIDYLRECVALQQKCVRRQLCLICIVLALGLMLVVFANLLSTAVVQDANQKLLMTLGGGFISSVATVPLKDVFNRRDRIAALAFLRQQYEHIEAAKDVVDTELVEQLDKRFWELISSSLGG